jgi:hypothetical protein
MIIGFHGCKGVGKDTAAKFLIDTYDFTKVAFADPLKDAVAALLDIPRDEVDTWKSDEEAAVILDWSYGRKEFNGREFLQRFGTEMGRNTFGNNFWVEQWEDHLYRHSMQADDIVVTDVRFRNEAEKIQELNGLVVRITRPGHQPDGHKSEEPLPDLLVDAEISNIGTIDDLHVDVHELYSNYARSQ